MTQESRAQKRHTEHYEALGAAHQAYREQQPIGPDLGDVLADAAKTVADKELQQDREQLLAEINRLRAELVNASAEAFRVVVDEIVGYCPDHGNQATARMNCACNVADEFRSRATAVAATSRS